MIQFNDNSNKKVNNDTKITVIPIRGSKDAKIKVFVNSVIQHYQN